MEIPMFVLRAVVLVLAGLSGQAIGSRRYDLYHVDELTWEDANDRCIERSRQFATVTSMDFQKEVERYGNNVHRHFWIGLRFNSSTNMFEWSDGSRLDWTNWADGFPERSDESGCVRMRRYDFAWETHNCSMTLNFLCEDTSFVKSSVVSTATKMTGLFMGLGVVGGLLFLCCMLLQLPCCRHNVSDRIADLGFGTQDLDKKTLF